MKSLLLILIFIMPLHAKCQGRFVNPLTDICWKCLFPMTIGGVKVVTGVGEDTKNPSTPLCACPRPPSPVPIPGIPVSFWEPARLVDVTRQAYCLVGLGGIQIGSKIYQHGSISPGQNQNGLKHSFYHVHYYVYPVIYWLELLTDFACLEKASVDVAYMTELDPMWDDDETSALVNPEGILFANPLAQAACAGDCAVASTGFPQDTLFWCGGCQGSLYPFSGTVSAHVSGIQASLLLTQRLLAKLHRIGMAWGTCGKSGLCQKYVMPIIKKTQYKTQLIFPIPSTQRGCHPLGRTETLWSAGKEYPTFGEDFVYLIWRKRNCCLF